MTKKTRTVRDTTLAHVDRDAPAYRIIYGVFGGLTPFVNRARKADRPIAKSTAHRWLIEGLIPSRRQADVVAIAEFHKVKLDLALFVPRHTAAAA